jgi:uncharacterized protein YidB (DUF937 family)
MGMLEDLLAGAMKGQAGGTRRPPGSGGLNTGALAALLPIVVAMLANRGGQRGGAGMGGGLGDILAQSLGRGPATGGGGLGDILGQVLGGGAGAGGLGGLGGLLEKLGQGGLGAQAQSWVGPGQNMSIQPGQIRDVFGSGGLAAIAQQAGLSEDDAADGLAQLLPEVVNRVTPQGRLPDGNELEATLEGLLKQFAR